MLYETIGHLVEGQHLRSITEDRNIYEVCCALDRFDVGALAVMRDDALVGIISERDVVRRVVVPGRDFITTHVADVMTPDPIVIDASASLVDALNRMIEGHFRHLPVIRNGRTVGMASIRKIPAEYASMKARYEEMIATPAAVAEAAVHRHLGIEPEPGGEPIPNFSVLI